MGVGYDNQIGANDCTYWTDYHLAGRYSATDPINEPPGYNDYDTPGFVWYN